MTAIGYSKLLEDYRAGRIQTAQVRAFLEQDAPLDNSTAPSVGVHVPFTATQKSLWLRESLYTGQSGLTVPVVIELDDHIAPEQLRVACVRLAARHPILSSVVTKDHKALRLEEPDSLLRAVSALKTTPDDPANWRAAVQALLTTQEWLPNAPLMRVYYSYPDTASTVVVFVLHHIISDASSLPVLAQSFLHDGFGAAETSNASVTVDDAFMRFAQCDVDVDVKPLGSVQPLTLLAPQASGVRRPASTQMLLPGDTVAALENVARSRQVSFATLALGIYCAALEQHVPDGTVRVGVAMDARPDAQFDAALGCFFNTIPIEVTRPNTRQFSDVLDHLKSEMIEGMATRHQPRIALHEIGEAGLQTSQGVFYHAGFVFHDQPRAFGQVVDQPYGETKARIHHDISQVGEHDFGIELCFDDDRVRLALKYDARRLAQKDAEAFLALYNQIARALVDSGNMPTTQDAAMPPVPVPVPVPHGRLDALIQTAIVQFPEKPAIACDERILTYAELGTQSQALCNRLKSCGVGPGDIVAVCAKRSPEMIVAMLGVMQSGAAYLPMDPSYPEPRLRLMIEDSKACMLIADTSPVGGNKLADDAAIDSPALTLWELIEPPHRKTFAPDLSRDETPLYLLYTSGSSGKPKGVVVSHKNVINLLTHFTKELPVRQTDQWLALTTVSFDISMLELFAPLISGALCRLVTEDVAKDADRLCDVLGRHQPSIIQATPMTWRMLLEAGWQPTAGMRLLCGGERLPQSLFDALIVPDVALYNLYGPTETTVWSTWQKLGVGDKVRIGQAIANTDLYLLDDRLHPVPRGDSGEICIGGAGVSLGYLGRPDLTADRFFEDPVTRGQHIYRTGDLGRWNPDGTLEFLGRLDDQVKVNGYRIELGECEEHIRAHTEILDCAVLRLDTGDEARLAAYLVPADPGVPADVLIAWVTQFLRDRVPKHVIPVQFTLMAHLPKTLNGKVDRQTLLAHDQEEVPNAQANIWDVDQRVIEIWREVLAAPSLGGQDLFLDNGGTSLRAVQLSRQLSSALGRRVTATNIFEYGCADALATYLAHSATVSDVRAADQAKVKPPAPVHSVGKDDVAIVGLSCSFAQARDARVFWQNLIEKQGAVTRFDLAAHAQVGQPKEGASGQRLVPVRSTLENPSTFDAAFFSVTPRDAAFADPQLRKLLQHAWAAVEDAGRCIDEIKDTAVYVTAAHSAYQSMLDTGARFSSAEGYAAWVLNQPGTIAGMISSKLGLQGESLHIHSNCSSSLVALRAGVDSLLSRRADFALVGAASIAAPIANGYVHEPGLNFSSTGVSRPFDTNADGLVPGDGVGVVLLRRARDAIADGDDIYCVIRGVNVNNDGGRKAGFYAPSAQAQSELIQKTLRACDVAPDTVRYLEAHGTGTRLGDAIEASALRSVFSAQSRSAGPLAIGSVKSNLGHLDVAAGMAGLIKVALALRSRQFPPGINFETANEECEFDPTSIEVIQDSIDCPDTDEPLRACISSFGLGGTNAHAVLETVAPREGAQDAVSDWVPIVLSGQTEAALRRNAQQLAHHIETAEPGDGLWPCPSLDDLSTTLMYGRMPQDHRLCIFTKSVADLVPALRSLESTPAPLTPVHLPPSEEWSDVPISLVDAVNAWIAEGTTDARTRVMPIPSGRRVHLPTYAFSEDHHGIDLTGDAAQQVPDQDSENSDTGHATLAFKENWRPAKAAAHAQACATRLILYAQDPFETDKAFADAVGNSATRTIVAVAGGRFIDRGRLGYVMDMGSKEGFSASLKTVLQAHADIDHIVYRGAAQADFETGNAGVNRFLNGALHADLGHFRVTLAPSSGSDLEVCYGEAWIGYAQSLRPSLCATSVHVLLVPPVDRETDFLTYLDKEPPGDHLSRIVRYIDGMRMVPQLDELDISAQAARIFPTHEPLQAGGAYIITGGGGALGRLLFRHLLNTGRLKGTRWLLLGRGKASSRLHALIEQAMECGVRVRYARADVAQRDDVVHALDLAGLRPEDVRGVIHAAGAEPFGESLADDPEKFDRNVRAKMRGARVLAELCSNAPLDFLCLVSSTSALIGDYGECSYAVANRFLNAYGKYISTTTTTAVSVLNWPLWAEGTMGRAKHQLAAQARLGFEPIASDEALELWAKTLGGPAEQLAVFRGHPAKMRSFLSCVANQTAVAPRKGPSTLAAPSKASVQTSARTVQTRLGALLQDCAAEILHMVPSDLSLYATFTDQGFDSFTLMQFANLVAGRLGIELSPAVLFSHQTPVALAQHLSQAHGAAVSARLCAPTHPVGDAQAHHTSAAGMPHSTPTAQDKIAIVGLSGRFAGADSVADLGQLLANRESAIAEVTSDRFSMQGIYGDPLQDARFTNGKWLATVNGVKEFDAPFFNISPREATDMDPRQRLLLQEFWHALEQAGLNRAALKQQRVGVFVGAEPGDYQTLRRISPITANHDALMAARLAYYLDLNGPVMTINTSCSSGMVALHQAYSSLRAGECDVAFVGAVNLILAPELLVQLGQAGMLSPSGACRPFDRRADGLVPGEAAVGLVLKRVGDAQSSGDVIQAQIDGCGINYDGFSMGVTAPNGAAQARLMDDVHRKADIDPKTIKHFMAHGTGTSLGDPIESSALTEVLRNAGVQPGHCALSSTKSSVGHSFAASGLVNLAALIASMHRGVIPAGPHDIKPSSHMNWDAAPVYLARENMPWDAVPDGLRRGATSAFGMSGTNAYAVVSHDTNATEHEENACAKDRLFVVSARNDAALKNRVSDLCSWLENQPCDIAWLERLMHTLNARRFHFEHRVAVIATDKDDLQTRWQRFLDEAFDTCVFAGTVTTDKLRELSTNVGGDVITKDHGNEALEKQARLYCEGHDIALNHDSAGPLIALTLPAYPFDRKEFWLREKDMHPAFQGADRADRPMVTASPLSVRPETGKIKLTPLDQVAQAPKAKPSAPATSAQAIEMSPQTYPQSTMITLQPVATQQESEPTLPRNEAKSSQKSADDMQLRATLRASLANMLLLEPEAVDPALGFTDQALDSILGVEWVRELNQTFGLEMKTSVLYDHPCIDEIAAHIAGLLGAVPDPSLQVPAAQTRTATAPDTLSAAAAQIETVVQDCIAEMLFLEAGNMDRSADFISLGLDSIIGVELVRMLNTRLDLSMRTSVLYDYPNVQVLCGHIQSLVVQDQPAPVARVQALRHVGDHQIVQEAAPLPSQEAPKTGDPSAQLPPSDAIAIIGASGRYPGIQNLDQYWQALVHGQDMVREVPPERGFGPDLADDNIYCNWMGSLDDVDRFDPLFFNISPSDAERMDPQHRLFLEEAYRTFEDAGYDVGRLSDVRCGVFLGIMGNEYATLQRQGTGRADAAEMLGGSHAVAAGRIAFHLNLKGPALAVDTACSSSLVAIHLACQSIQNGDADIALAGGVSTYLLPDSYVGMCDAGMLSPRGRCHAFDENADGFVPSEGVGCVLLKSLSQALKDGDRIDGVIMGSGINQDGRTNGITAPSGKSQTALLQGVYERHQIDPSAIQYAELHGTGTALGDPIELEALANAFENRGASVDPLRIGSVKSNLGHCSAAAGVAGLHKLLLMLRHRQFVPTIHVQNPTSRFDFDGAPLALGTDVRAWPQPENNVRQACLSSFGYSGTNAHLVLAQWSDTAGPSLVANAKTPQVLVFSARTEDQLRDVAGLMAQHFEWHPDLSFQAVADTLRRGRRAMRHRLAVVASDLAQAAQRLGEFAGGLLGSDHMVSASLPAVLDSKEVPRAFASFESPHDLARAWVGGATIDWSVTKDQKEQPVSRVRLPGYPFEKKRCWIALPDLHETGPLKMGTSKVFSINHRFEGTERVITEHVVDAQPLLPGAASLDLVLDAAATASGQRDGLYLTGGAWLRPIAPGDNGVDLTVTGARQGSDKTRLSLTSNSGADGETAMEHFSCVLHAGRPSGAPSDIDPLALTQAMVQDVAGTAQLIVRQKRAGIEYGPSYQSIGAVYRGGGNKTLVRLDPKSADNLDDGCYLSPSLLDAALQTASFAIPETDETIRIPYAFKAVQTSASQPDKGLLLNRGEDAYWVSIETSPNQAVTGPQVTVQVTIYDATGRWLLSISDLTLRTTGKSATLIERLAPEWQSINPARTQAPMQGAEHAIWLVGFNRPQHLRTAIENLGDGSQPKVFQVGLEGDTPEQVLAALHASVQSFVQGQNAKAHLLEFVVADDDRCLAAASALLRSLRHERTRLTGRTFMVPPCVSPADVAQILKTPLRPDVDHLRLEGSGLMHQVWAPQKAHDPKGAATGPAMAWRDDGVYLVTGGSGAIGREMATWMAQHRPNARLILCGRSPEDAVPSLRDVLARDQVTYHCVDVSDNASVASLGQSIASTHGRLTGVIHAAGLVQDKLLGDKTAGDVATVLAAKTVGLRLVDAMSARFDLDFFCAFSSVSAVLGVAGQTDYGMANAYMDAFIGLRQHAVHTGARNGKSLSINWPIWQSGGMRVDPARLNLLEQSQGVKALTTGQAMQVFEHMLEETPSNVMVLASDGRKIEHPSIQRSTAPTQNTARPEPSSAAKTVDSGQIEQIIIQAAAAQLGVAPSEIDLDANLGDYGFDSISFTKLGAALNEELNLDLTPPIFFEFLTVARLAEYICGLEGLALPQHVQAQSDPIAQTAALDSETSHQKIDPHQAVPHATAKIVAKAELPNAQDDIAIIGISGAFSGADDIDGFWDNLLANRTCISDLPIERAEDWNLSAGVSVPTRAGFMEGIDQFDPLFFNMSPKEAELMDPHQRLLLLHAWRAVEDAGYAASDLRGTDTAVYFGTAGSGYAELLQARGASIESHTATGNVASVAPNRVSYLFDLHGPSEPVETACSSGLVAIHKACETIRQGHSSMALAGAVNVLATATSHVSFHKAGMLSPSSACKTFSADADGYVRGEGVGVLLLKSLSAAEKDGDAIYGVVRGSAVNHGGQASSFTSPNPNAQAALIVKAVENAKIDPGMISYFECHGTGTPLGDPIEVEGLVSAFGQLDGADPLVTPSARKLGSVKSNIGHLELAAGIAGTFKVLMQIKHRQLVGSLNSQPVNPYLRMEGTGFSILHDNQPWQGRMRADGTTDALIAGVSSFGFGGTNAHVILGQHVPNVDHADVQVSAPTFALPFILSAADASLLCVQARALATKLEAGPVDLVDLSYTLCCGRMQMPARMAFVATTLPEVLEVLEQCAAAEDLMQLAQSGVVCFGAGTAKAGTFAGLEKDAAFGAMVRQWAVGGQTDRLIDIWCSGTDVPWREVFSAFKPRRLHLPTYPFLLRRYWFGGSANGADIPAITAQTRTATTQVSVAAKVAQHHRIKGRPVLPGATYTALLLKERAALECSVFSNLRWPHWMDAAQESDLIHLAMHRKDGSSEVAFSSGSEGRPNDVYCRADTSDSASPVVQAEVDLVGLTDGLVARDAKDLYAYFASLGMAYGDLFRVLDSYWVKGDRVLAKLKMPVSLAECSIETAAVVFDAMFHAGGAWQLQEADQERRLGLPTSADQITIHDDTMSAEWIVVERVHSSAEILRSNLLLCDGSGRVIVRIENFLSVSAKTPAPEKHDAYSVLTPIWQPCVPTRTAWCTCDNVLIVGATGALRDALATSYPMAVFADWGTSEISAQLSRDDMPADALLTVVLVYGSGTEGSPSAAGAPSPKMDRPARATLELVKVLVANGFRDKQVAFKVSTLCGKSLGQERPDPAQAAVHGFMGALAKERPNWTVEMFDFATPQDRLASLALTLGVRAGASGAVMLQRSGQWYDQKLVQAPAADVGLRPTLSAFRERGVYLILGGAGGLGVALSQWLSTLINAQIVWVGRRDPALIEETRNAVFAVTGSMPVYLQADASDARKMAQVNARILADYGRLDGVFIATMHLHDTTVDQIAEQELVQALNAKMHVCQTALSIFSAARPDFITHFGSTQSFSTEAGQAAYAAASQAADAVMQAYAKNAGQDGVQVNNVHWSFWGTHGAVATPKYRDLMLQRGIASLEPAEAFAALDSMLKGPSGSDIAVICTTRPLQSVLGDMFAASPRSETLDHMNLDQVAQSNRNLEQSLVEVLSVVLFGFLETLPAYVKASDFDRYIDVKYANWVSMSLRFIAEQGLITPVLKGTATDQSVYATGPSLQNLVGAKAAISSVQERWQAFVETHLQDPHIGPQVGLVSVCIAQLADVLTGDVPAVQVLFPDSSARLTSGVYEHGLAAKHFNGCVADAVAGAVRQANEQGKPAHILEVGAGSGATTAAVLKALDLRSLTVQDYCFSDISPSLLDAARHRFEAGPAFLRYQRFDLEGANGQAVLDEGQFDIIVAANVLHATANIVDVLSRLRGLLAPGGSLVLAEIADANLFTHASFGLLEGWWLFNDDRRIPGCPGLYPNDWRSALEEAGFASVAFPAAPHHHLGQQVIVACAPEHPHRDTVPAAAATAAPLRHELPTQSKPSVSGGTDELIRDAIAGALGLQAHQIHYGVPLERYGVDSLMHSEILARLRPLFQNLPDTVLFEYPSVKELAAYVDSHDLRVKTPNSTRVSPVAAQVAATVLPERASETPQTPEAERGTPAVAIVGMAGQFPGCPNIDALWEALVEGRNCISPQPADRWPDQNSGTMFGGFLKNPDQFDFAAFGLDKDNLGNITPELGLLLETCWHAMENAGYGTSQLSRLADQQSDEIGVFVASMYDQSGFAEDALGKARQASNTTGWNLANRLSHMFNLTGPSMFVNTACSSAVSALHLACQSIRTGHCPATLVAGVNLTLDPSKYDALNAAGFLGTGSMSRSFGEGDGFIPSEAVAAVYLKRLDLALRDGDPIRAVIKAEGVAHSGGRQSYTAPDSQTQSRLISRVLTQGNVAPVQIGYVESSANGSLLGDAVEMTAIKNALDAPEKNALCALGAVKSNLGHMEAASGIVQLIKAVLQIERGELVPSINSMPANPLISLDGTRFAIQQSCGPWPAHSSAPDARNTLITSFGAGGSYGCLLVGAFENKPDQDKTAAPFGPVPILLSAHSQSALRRRARDLIAFVTETATSLNDLSWSLFRLEHDLPMRWAATPASLSELLDQLDALASGQKPTPDLESTSELARWCRAEEIDIEAQFPPQHGPFIRLPEYPFEHATPQGQSPSAKAPDLSWIPDPFDKLIAAVKAGLVTDSEFAQRLGEMNDG